MPGFEPGQPRRAYSLDQVVDAIRRVVERACPGEQVTLLLHDWGCVFGYQFAMRHPELVKRVIGVDIGDAGSRHHVQALGLKAKAMLFAYQGWLALAWRIGGRVGDWMARTMARALRCPSDRTFIGSQMGYPYYLQWTGALRKAKLFTPTCPVLFIYGKRKPFMFHSSGWAEGLASRAGSQAVGFDTGHWVMIEKPEDFDQTVAEWMIAGDAASEKYFLASRMTGQGEQMGLYLVDVFGNEVLLHSEAPGWFDPMPLASRLRPPVLPARRDSAGKEGYFYVADVYQGTHMAGVKRGAVKWLRVVESPEKRFWTDPVWGGQGIEGPAMNWHDFNNKRILGTVPVEADGSASFEVPAMRSVFFVALDENDLSVKRMQSFTSVQPGETTSCVGCHEYRTRTAQSAANELAALRRLPSRIEPVASVPDVFDFPRDIQPILNDLCADCHGYEKTARGGPRAGRTHSHRRSRPALQA